MRRLSPLWILVLIFVVFLIYLPGFSKYLRLKHKEDELDREMKRLQAQIVQLEQAEHLLKTDLTELEEVVRQELGLVKPGEIVYRIVEEETPEVEAEQNKNPRSKPLT